ncbi:MAG: LLM class flavin-dependent oxidoreductase, partial [Acidimicrobiales bacterium]
DHLWPMGRPDRPALAPFPMLGALATSTSALFLGTLVARIGIVPDATLVGEFCALEHLAPGRIIAGIGTGDHLSFNENRAYGIVVDPADERRGTVGDCARSLKACGLPVWIGGLAAETVRVAEEVGVPVNFWQTGPGRVADQATRSEVTWAGMARPGGGGGEDLDADGLLEVARPIAGAGASWLVFGWPIRLSALGEASEALRRD